MADAPTTPLTTKLTVIKSANDPLPSRAGSYEDTFAGKYGLGGFKEGASVIEPPYDPVVLERLAQENNALAPCIAAMETNIDGTGYRIKATDSDDPPPAKDIAAVTSFFDEPYPGESFTTMRKKLRRDIEITGNGYLEGIRNMRGELVFLRHVESKTIRLVTLDAPKMVERIIVRNGKAEKLKVWLRERRFVQDMGQSKFVFFKQFGSNLDLNKDSGQWVTKGQRLPLDIRAGELLHFTAIKDSITPYGVPRWISQLPSVLGSRKAEEHNLGFFEGGGVPPILILVQGGTLATDAVKALKDELLNSGSKNRAAVLEAHSVGGDINAAGNVRLTVERFGAERQQDAMFETYDARSEQRVRRAFRLPPLFVGQAVDYNRATAYTSYMVAEAQVFQPERLEFDETINLVVMPSILNSANLEFTSKPLTVKDVDNQLRGIELMGDKASKESLVHEVNEVVNLDLEVNEEEAPAPAGVGIPGFGAPAPAADSDDSDNDPEAEDQAEAQTIASNAVQKGAYEATQALAEEVCECIINNDRGIGFELLMQKVSALSPGERQVFKGALAIGIHGHNVYDPQGAAEVAMATLQALATTPRAYDA